MSDKGTGASGKDEATRRRILRPVNGVIQQYILQIQEIDQVLHLSIDGISLLIARPNAIQALASIDKTLDVQSSSNPDETAKQLRRAKAEAELAQREIDRGFPLLFAQAVLSLWSVLESAIPHFLANWLISEPALWKAEAVQNLKIRVGDFEALSSEDKALYVIELLDQEARAPLKQGINRFEDLLKAFGLSAPVEDGLKKTFFEMQQVRNVIAHRHSVADRRLAKSCPWLGLKVGDAVTINHNKYGRYRLAVIVYLGELCFRVVRHYGIDPDSLDADISLEDMDNLVFDNQGHARPNTSVST